MLERINETPSTGCFGAHARSSDSYDEPAWTTGHVPHDLVRPSNPFAEPSSESPSPTRPTDDAPASSYIPSASHGPQEGTDSPEKGASHDREEGSPLLASSPVSFCDRDPACLTLAQADDAHASGCERVELAASMRGRTQCR
jgi:hypothetical protein